MARRPVWPPVSRSDVTVGHYRACVTAGAWQVNLGDGNFGPPRQMGAVPYVGDWAFAAADLDGDGIDDVLTISFADTTGPTRDDAALGYFRRSAR